MHSEKSSIRMGRKMPEFFEKSPPSRAEKHRQDQGTSCLDLTPQTLILPIWSPNICHMFGQMTAFSGTLPSFKILKTLPETSTWSQAVRVIDVPDTARIVLIADHMRQKAGIYIDTKQEQVRVKSGAYQIPPSNTSTPHTLFKITDPFDFSFQFMHR